MDQKKLNISKKTAAALMQVVDAIVSADFIEQERTSAGDMQFQHKKDDVTITVCFHKE